MCQNCQTGFNPGEQIDYLRRYLAEQRTRLERNPDDEETAAQVEKTAGLIRSLEAQN